MRNHEKRDVVWMVNSWTNGHLFGTPNLNHWYYNSVGKSLFYDWGWMSDQKSLNPEFEVVLVRRLGNEQS